MKRKVLSVLLCAVMTAGILVGCGNSKEETTADASKKESGKQEITIAIGDSYKPFCYLNEQEKPDGYEYALFSKVAEKMSDKYEVNIVCDSWDNLFLGVDSGKYDIVSHHMAYNAEREEKYTVSKESLMFYGNYRFLYKKGRTDITDIASTAGMTLANNNKDNIGKVLQAYNDEHADNPIILQETMPSLEAIISGIENGLYDAYTHTQFDLQTKYLDMYPDADIEMGTVNLLDDDVDCGTYALMKKGNTELQEDFDSAIKSLRDDGTIKELCEEWFGADYSVKPE